MGLESILFGGSQFFLLGDLRVYSFLPTDPISSLFGSVGVLKDRNSL